MPHVTFKEALRVWILVALQSFGGPAGQIAVMHRILVEEKKWIDEKHFLHALNYCMLLPGPEAQQLAIYIGWLLHKIKGGLVAGLLFILPGFVSILFLSLVYAVYGDQFWVQGIFYGIKPAILAIVIGAVIRIGKKALKNRVLISVSVLAFVSIFFFNISFPIIILTAALIGFVGGKIHEETFFANKISGDIFYRPSTKPKLSSTVLTVLCWLAIWSVPFAIIYNIDLGTNVFRDEIVFFSKTAVVTFGGAYSVLSYMAQRAVETYHWLMPGEMLDGLGMAETTPGPLIQVVQFVGFMGAFRDSGMLDPLLAGVLASGLVTWVTFAPCFLFIFAGAPYIEYLRGNKHLGTTLTAITAAVVGVVLNLAVWFSLHTWFHKIDTVSWNLLRLLVPEFSSVDYFAVAVTGLACLGYFKLKWNMPKTILISVITGFCLYVLRLYIDGSIF